MEIRIKVKDIKTESVWWENYNISDNETPFQWAIETVEKFNKTLKTGENPRELVDVEIIREKSDPFHYWEKVNFVTIVEKNGKSYDKYKCNNCGITGKRYGLSQNIERDRKYKAKIYETCNGARKQISINKKRRERKKD